MSRFSARTDRLSLRSCAGALVAIVLMAWAVVQTSATIDLPTQPPGRRAQWERQQAARYLPMREKLSTERAYRFVLPGDDTSMSDDARARDFVRYLLAPVVIEQTGDSPWLVVDAGNEDKLDTWLSRHEVRIVERVGEGLAIVREVQP